MAIARALAIRPLLLVCDEPVSALDVSVRAQISNLLDQLRSTYGMSYLFITHDLAVVRQVVERVYVMHRGVVVENGAVDDALDNPKDEYTASPIDSPPVEPGRARLVEYRGAGIARLRDPRLDPLVMEGIH